MSFPHPFLKKCILYALEYNEQVSTFKFTWFQGEHLHIVFKRIENKFEGLGRETHSFSLVYRSRVICRFYVRII